MIRAIQDAPRGYVPPNEKKLAGPQLDANYEAMWRKVNARDPNGLLKEKFGSAYVSDGWDSCDHLPLINSAFISANDGGVYWRSVDTSGHTKSAEYCALLVIQDIYAYGPQYVVLIVTDTCATMAKAWALVEDEFPFCAASRTLSLSCSKVRRPPCVPLRAPRTRGHHTRRSPPRVQISAKTRR